MAYDETYDSSLLLKLEAVKIMFTRPYELSFMEKKNTHTHRTRIKDEKNEKYCKLHGNTYFLILSIFHLVNTYGNGLCS